MWDFPGPGLKPNSLALADGFLTTDCTTRETQALRLKEVVSLIALAMLNMKIHHGK